MSLRTIRLTLTILFISLWIGTSAPTILLAASIEFTASVRSSLDKIIATTDNQSAERINQLYNDLRSLSKQAQDLDERSRILHYHNEQTLIALNKQIKLIDAAKLNALAVRVEQTKKRYTPLFTLYTSLNQQITAAKKLKNKRLNSILNSQINGMKFSVQFARQDLRNKQAALRTEKDRSTKTIKSIRMTLSEIAPEKSRIRAERSSLSVSKKSVSSAWSNFKYALKRGEAKNTNNSLSSLNLLSRRMVEQKEKIYNLEKKISDILRKAKTQMPTK